ncbi:MAG: hypothetical protein ACOY0T_02975 [Myxococcota bacterium]
MRLKQLVLVGALFLACDGESTDPGDGTGGTSGAGGKGSGGQSGSMGSGGKNVSGHAGAAGSGEGGESSAGKGGEAGSAQGGSGGVGDPGAGGNEPGGSGSEAGAGGNGASTDGSSDAAFGADLNAGSIQPGTPVKLAPANWVPSQVVDPCNDCPPGFSCVGSGTAATCQLEHELPKGRVCSLDGFCFWDPLPQSEDLLDVYALAADDVWAVGKQATVMHYDGKAWSGISQLIRVEREGLIDGIEFSRVFARSSTDAWITGRMVTNDVARPIVLHGDGKLWRKIQLPHGASSTESIVAISGAATGDVWFLTNSGNLLVYSAGSFSAPLRLATTGADLQMLTPQLSYVVAGGDLLRYQNGDWSVAFDDRNNSLRAIDAPSADELWAIGDEGLLHLSAGTWLRDATISGSDVFAGSPTGAWIYGYFSGMGAEGLIHFDGARYHGTRVLSPARVHGVREADALAVGGLGNIWQLRQGAIEHVGGFAYPSEIKNEFVHRFDVNYVATSAVSKDDIWFGGSHEVVLIGYEQWPLLKHFDGKSFTRHTGAGWRYIGIARGIEGGYHNGINAVHALPTGEVVAATGLAVSRLLPNESSFGTIANSPMWIEGLYAASSSDIWAAQGGQNSLKQFNGGAWSNAAPASVVALWGSSASDVWAVGASAHHYDGTSWTTHTLLQAAVSVWARGPNEVYVYGNGCVQRFDGTSFKAVTTAECATPPNSRDGVITGCGTSDLWVADHSDRLSHFDGAQWSLVRTGVERIRTLLCTAPNDVWAAGANGAILRQLR